MSRPAFKACESWPFQSRPFLSAACPSAENGLLFTGGLIAEGNFLSCRVDVRACGWLRPENEAACLLAVLGMQASSNPEWRRCTGLAPPDIEVESAGAGWWSNARPPGPATT